MPFSDVFWNLGTQLTAKIQARDRDAAKRLVRVILGLIARETKGHFSHYKLRTLQVLTNVNRAAFNAGAPTERLHAHSRRIVAIIDGVGTEKRLVALAHSALEKAIDLIPAENVYQERVIQEAIAYIREHFTEDITRDHLAARVHRSPAHFSRLFSRTTGRPYKDFLLECRFEKAKDLLQHSHLNVAEIARAVGYQDPFQFSKVFRRRVGVSPRQFRDHRVGATPRLREVG